MNALKEFSNSIETIFNKIFGNEIVKTRKKGNKKVSNDVVKTRKKGNKKVLDNDGDEFSYEEPDTTVEQTKINSSSYDDSSNDDSGHNDSGEYVDY